MTPGDHATTPADVLEAVRAFAPIGLDPCWNPNAITNPERYHDGGETGDWLALEWEATPETCVFVNPPYSRGQLAKWVAKCDAEAKRDRRRSILLLVPADTSARWWQAAWASADACCFVSKRVRFGGYPNRAKAGSCVFGWSASLGRFAWALRRLGIVVVCADHRSGEAAQ